jgi:hypothetical protein
VLIRVFLYLKNLPPTYYSNSLATTRSIEYNIHSCAFAGSHSRLFLLGSVQSVYNINTGNAGYSLIHHIFLT